MAILDTPPVICDVCGTPKQQTNHWYLLVLGCMGGEVTILEWNDASARFADGHACGQGCVQKLLSRWFESRTFETPRCNEAAITQGEN